MGHVAVGVVVLVGVGGQMESEGSIERTWRRRGGGGDRQRLCDTCLTDICPRCSGATIRQMGRVSLKSEGLCKEEGVAALLVGGQNTIIEEDVLRHTGLASQEMPKWR